MGRDQDILVSRGTGRPCATSGRLGIRPWTGYRRTHKRRRTMHGRNRGKLVLDGRKAGTGLPT